MGGGGGNQHLDSSVSRYSNANISSLRGKAEAIQNKNIDCHELFRDSRNDEFLNCHDFANEKSHNDVSFVNFFGDKSPRNDKRNESSCKSNNNSIRFTPKFYFILGIIFNLCLLGFFKYTDFLLENFNAFSKLARLDFDIPLPHILLPLALSFVTFQQIAFLFDCYKRTKGELSENLHIDFVDYALFISFFPQLIAGPIVHHREMMPQFSAMGNSSSGNHCADLLDFESSQTLQSSSLPKSSKNSTSTTANTRIGESANPSLLESTQCVESKQSTKSKNSPSLAERARGWVDSTINYEYLAKGIFIFSIGLFKKVFIADSFAKWANAGFGVVEQGGVLNIVESWATSLSYTFQLYFDFSGYCDMAIGLALMFGIVLPLNFDSPYKSLNIAEFWRRWHITLGRFLRECLYIQLGGNRGKGNSSLTRPSRELEKSLLDRQQVLSHADFSAQPTNLTQDTRIANDSQKQSYITKILTLRNLFIVAFLSGVWHGAGWGFVIWGVLHGVAMVIHRIYSWWLANSACGNKIFCHTERSEVSKSRESQANNESMTKKRINESHRFTQSKQIANDSKVAKMDSSLHALRSAQNDEKLIFTKTKFYKFLCWFITFNFVNIAWIFFRAENLNGAVNLIKGMFGIASVEIPHKWSKIFSTLQGGTNEIIIWVVCAFIVCLALKNSFEMLKDFDTQYLRFRFSLRIFSKKIYLKGGAVWTRFVLTIALFYTSIWILLKNLLDSNAYTPFLYFNF